MRVKNAPAYHDHNWGRFSLSGGRLAGWDWSQAFLPSGRALTVGVVKGVTGPPDGVAVLSGPARRLGTARSADLDIDYRGWSRAGAFVYPPTMRQRGSLGDASLHQVMELLRKARGLHGPVRGQLGQERLQEDAACGCNARRIQLPNAQTPTHIAHNGSPQQVLLPF